MSKATNTKPGLGKLAIGVERSTNKKLGNVSSTYASQRSCPVTCPFQGHGCYAEDGHAGMITARLNASNPFATPRMVAVAEAAVIDSLSGKRPLRLHVVGDGVSEAAVVILRRAVHRYVARFGQRAWTYTHAWRKVPRKVWGKNISVLASCESLKAVRKANEAGYAAAIVVDEHPADGKSWRFEEFNIIPCPEQTGKAKSCADCRLCWNDAALLKRGAVIAFAAHGTKEGQVSNALQRIQGLFEEAEAALQTELRSVAA